MMLAYVSGPYSAPTKQERQANVDAAVEVMRKYMRLGYSVICPHSNTHPLDGEFTWEEFMAADLEQVSRCDVVVFLPRWRESRGARVEHDLALELGKELIYE